MKSMRKWNACFVALILSISLLVGCGGAANEQTEKPEFIFNESNPIDSSESTSENSTEGGSQKEDDSSSETTKPSDDTKPEDATKPSGNTKPSGDSSAENTKPSGDSSTSGSGSNSSENSGSGNNSSSSGNSGSSGNTSSGSGSNNTTLTKDQKIVKPIVDSIITSGMSDFQKALAIHDWLTFNIDYDNSLSNFYVEETIRDKKGVCQGYALCFKAMAECAGLEVTYVTGSANNGVQTLSHAWNQVKIDGKWYNVDVTWDDPTTSNKNPNDHSANGYAYFLISDTNIYKNHYPNSDRKTCAADYPRSTIYKTALASGKHSNAAYVSNTAELNEAVKKYMNAEADGLWVWYYNTSLTNANVSSSITTFASSCQYPAQCTTFYYPDDGITKFYVEINKMSEWNKISVVTNKTDFAEFCKEKYNSGIKKFNVRYETEDGNHELLFIAGNSVSYSYTSYNGGKGWLMTIELT